MTKTRDPYNDDPKEYVLRMHEDEQRRRDEAMRRVPLTKEALDRALAEEAQAFDAVAEARREEMDAARDVGAYRLRKEPVPEAAMARLAAAEAAVTEARRRRDATKEATAQARNEHENALVRVQSVEVQMRQDEDSLLDVRKYDADTFARPGKSGYPCARCRGYPDEHERRGLDLLCPPGRLKRNRWRG